MPWPGPAAWVFPAKIDSFNIPSCCTDALVFTAPGRYGLAQSRGIFRELGSPTDLTARNIILRIVENRKAFEARNAKKVKSEQAYYEGVKGYVQEL